MTTNLKTDLSFLFEAPVQHLLGWNSPLLSEKAFAFYHQTLIHYFTGNQSELSALINEAQNGCSEKDLDSRAALRLAGIRSQLLQKEELLQTHQKVSAEELQSWPRHWHGEYWALQARWYDLQEKNELAAQAYDKASIEYYHLNCFRKALRCYFNSLICKDRLNLGTSYHYDYIKLARQARPLKEYNTMIMCYIALSQKLGDIGAFRLALKYANKAIKRAQHEIGSNDYFKALLQRAFIYFLNNNLDKANRDLNEARLSYGIEIKSTIEFLDAKFNQNKSITLPPSRLIAAGIYERANQFFKHLSPMSVMEEKFIHLLLLKPRTKLELLNHLWDHSIAIDSREMRLKSLLKSIREKAPQSILFENDLYQLESLEIRVQYV